MQRREFITLLGGSAVAWPVATLAQQPDQVRRIGWLVAAGNSSLYGQKTQEAFTNALRPLGWIDGNNIQIDYWRAEYDAANAQVLARKLVALKPDVILAINTLAVAACQRETKSIPIVFVAVTDPVASGFVESLSRPGGNITGFSNFEPTLVGKYIEILKEINPGMTAVAEMYNPDANLAYLKNIHPVLEIAARYHAVELITAPVRDDADVERVISSLGDRPTTGLIVAGEPFLRERLDLINSFTIRYRVPAVYAFRVFVEGGGLISYGNDLTEQYRQAAAYIDRILRGASPADLPVQAPSKFEMAINLKTARAMRLNIPPPLLARADEVIE